jgi:hypothetical protein
MSEKEGSAWTKRLSERECCAWTKWLNIKAVPEQGILPEQDGSLYRKAVPEQDKWTGRLSEKMAEQEGCLNNMTEQEGCAWTNNWKIIPEQGNHPEQYGFLNRKAVPEQDDWKGRLCLNKMTEQKGCSWTRWPSEQEECFAWTGRSKQDGCRIRKFVSEPKGSLWTGRLCLNRTVSEIWVSLWPGISLWTCTYILLRRCLMSNT